MLLSEKSTQIKVYSSWEASYNIKKKFWFIYTRLRSSTLLYISLDSYIIV